MKRNRTPIISAAILITALIAACSSPAGGGTPAASSSSSGSTADSTAASALGIDPSKCPADITAKFGATVNIGETAPLSGPVAAALTPIAQGVKAAFDYYNATDNLPTKFKLIQLDDQFTPNLALTDTQQLIEQDHVVAMTSIVGTPQALAVADLLDSQCVPLLPAVTNGQDVNDPTKYPWMVPDSLPSAVDVQAMIDNIATHFPQGAKIALLYSDDASGDEYLANVKRDIGGTKDSLVSSQTIEDADTAAPTSQVTTMQASGANVLIAAPSASQFASLFTAVAGTSWKPTIYASATGAAIEFDVAGAAANGVYYDQYLKDPARAPWTTDPGVLAWEKIMKQYVPSAPITQTSLAGFVDATFFWEAVKAAAASPLGLTRLGLLDAARTLHYQSSLQPTGVVTALDGLTDPVAIESTLMGRYDSATKEFVNVKLYDFQGEMAGLASIK